MSGLRGCLKTFQVVWKVSSLSVSFTYCLEFFPDCLETFQIICKLSWLSGKFTDYLESFQVICKLLYCLEISKSVLKVSRLCGNFPEYLENFQIVLTVPLFSRKFLHCLGCVCFIWKVSRSSCKLRNLRDNHKSAVNMDCFQNLFKLFIVLFAWNFGKIPKWHSLQGYKKKGQCSIDKEIENVNNGCTNKKQGCLKLWNAVNPKQICRKNCWSHNINMMWTFKLSRPNCFGYRAFQSFRWPCFSVVRPLYFNYAPLSQNLNYALFVAKFEFMHFFVVRKVLHAKVCSPESFQLFFLCWLNMVQ